MNNLGIYIYRYYEENNLLLQYLRVKDCCGTLIWSWCDFPKDATMFDDITEAKKICSKIHQGIW